METIIEKAWENKVYYEFFSYGESRMVLQQDKDFVLNEMREPKPESEDINEWISRQKAIKEEIEWTEAITGTQFSKFYFFSRTKEAINNWKMELAQLQKEMPFTMTPSSSHSDNDLKMFEFVGHAVAMKNAPDHIKVVVDDITEFTCNEDGIYQYLRANVLALKI